jgi:hypothetical protein
MKTTILALSVAAIAAMTNITGASATYYGHGDYFRPSHKTIDQALNAYRIDRHYTETSDYRRHKSDDWSKRTRYANRGWCSKNPGNWRCQSSH